MDRVYPLRDFISQLIESRAIFRDVNVANCYVRCQFAFADRTRYIGCGQISLVGVEYKQVIVLGHEMVIVVGLQFRDLDNLRKLLHERRSLVAKIIRRVLDFLKLDFSANCRDLFGQKIDLINVRHNGFVGCVFSVGQVRVPCVQGVNQTLRIRLELLSEIH